MLTGRVTLMLMGKWITKILLPLLLLALIVAYFESGSVKTINPDSGRSGSISKSQTYYSPNRNAAQGESRLAIGERYITLADLVADQQTAGYLRVGTFGKNWPAQVTEIINDANSIAFVKGDGTKHNYTGFDGYQMKVVRLKAGERETIVVFRSEEKR